MSDIPAAAVKMRIRALVMDPVSNMPVVILQSTVDETSLLPIWIGVCEANSIALKLEQVTTPRPMTHDLMHSLVSSTGHRIEHIHIHTLADSVFIASIHLRDGDGTASDVDARPSDALALALRAEASIFVSTEVLGQAQLSEGTEEDAIKAMLERMRPEDLGEYEM